MYICFWSYTGRCVLPQVGRVVFGLVYILGGPFVGVFSGWPP